MSFLIDFDVQDAKLKKVETAIDTLAKKATAVSAELQKMANVATKDAKAIDQLKKAETAAAGAASKLKSEVKSTEKPLNDQARASKRAAQEAAALRAALNAVGTHMGIFTGQTILVASAVYGVVSAFKSMVTVGIGFTGEMARAIPIMGATAEQAKFLEAEVRRLGETTVFTGQEAAGGLTALAMSGMNASQAFEALAPALHLAAIGQIDMYRSADILTNVMFGFRLSAEDTGKVVDDLATAITSSNATIEQMGSALSYVAPVATAAGASIEEVTAMLEVFHNAGIKGSRAGTSLRRAYNNLLSPTEKQQKVLDSLNITTLDVNGSMLELSDIMNQLADNGAVTADIMGLFGVRAAPAMLALLSDMQGVNSQFEVFRRNLDNNEGAAKNLTKAFEKALGPDIRKLVSALQEKALSMFKDLESGFRSLVQQATEFVRTISPEDIKKIADGMVSFGNGLKFVVGYADNFLLIWGTIKALKLAAWIGGLAAGTTIYSSAMLGATAATGTMATASGFLSGALVAVQASLSALKAAMLAHPITAIAVVLATAGYAAYEYFSEVSKGTTATEKLTEAQRKQVDYQKQLNDLNKASLEFARTRGIQKQDPFLAKTDKEISQYQAKAKLEQDNLTKLRGQLKDLRSQFIVDDTNVKAQEDIRVAMQNSSQSAQDYSDAILRLTQSQQRYNDTGLTPDGVRLQQDYRAELKALGEEKFGDLLSKQFDTLGTSLKQMEVMGKQEKLTAVEVLFGSEAAIKNRAESFKSAYEATILPLNEKLLAIEKKRRGDVIDPKEIGIIKALKDAKLEYDSAVEKLAGSQQKVNNAFDAFLGKAQSIEERGAAYLSNLGLEIMKLNGVEVALKSKQVAELEGASATLQAAIASATAADASDVRIEKLKAEKERIDQLALSIGALQKVKSATEEGGKEGGKLKKDFEAGKFLSPDDKAQREYDQGLAQLDAYRALKDEMLLTDEQYNDAKLNLDKQLWESQNEMWTNIKDSTTSAITSNLTQAIMLQESWADTGKNIKKAIYGSVISSLVAAGVETASTALMSLFYKDKEVAAEGAKGLAIGATTAEEVVAHGVRMGIITSSAATAGISATALSATLATAGGAVLTTWGPAALAVSLATAGGNSPLAIAGIEAASLAMISASAATASIGKLAGTREIGGPVNSGQSYLVGERGAEIFTPTTPGAITSNADAKRGLNSNKDNGSQEVEQTIVNNYYYIDAIDTESFDQRLAKSGGTINQINNKENARRGIRTGRR